MVVKNNYFWLKPPVKQTVSPALNSDLIKEFYGFKSMEFTLSNVVRQSESSGILINATTIRNNILNEIFSFYKSVQEDYKNEKGKITLEAILADPYFNALQVKYAYAVTCHKSQGGQWVDVYIDQGFITKETNKDFFRWLYTAITRAKKGLYLVGFPKEYFN